MDGLLLIASPRLFGFADRVFQPPVILGVLEIGAALMTPTSETGSRDPGRRYG